MEPGLNNLKENLMMLHYRLSRLLNFYITGPNQSVTEANFHNILMAIKPRISQFKIELHDVNNTWEHVKTFHLRTSIDKHFVLFEQSQVGFLGFAKQIDAIVCKVRDNVYKKKGIIPSPPQDSAGQGYSFENDMKILYEIGGRQFALIGSGNNVSTLSSSSQITSYGYSAPVPSGSPFGPPPVAIFVPSTPTNPRETSSSVEQQQPNNNFQNNNNGSSQSTLITAPIRNTNMNQQNLVRRQSLPQPQINASQPQPNQQSQNRNQVLNNLLQQPPISRSMSIPSYRLVTATTPCHNNNVQIQQNHQTSSSSSYQYQTYGGSSNVTVPGSSSSGNLTLFDLLQSGNNVVLVGPPDSNLPSSSNNSNPNSTRAQGVRNDSIQNVCN
jgi:hypothetical protein